MVAPTCTTRQLDSVHGVEAGPSKRRRDVIFRSTAPPDRARPPRRHAIRHAAGDVVIEDEQIVAD
jgi:hypothetical protein